MYVQRVNLAIDHIVRHLKEPLRLEDVARVACFSPFHFHRIFQAALGETLNQFVRRLRLERAIGYMSHGRKRSLTEIALACGFRSSSDFSRAFKQRFGVPPRDFDLQTFRDQRREDLKAIGGEAMAPYQLDRLPPGTNPDGFEAQLVDLPPRTVAYLRVLDPFRPDVVFAATERLVAWAESRGLADRNWMGYMWEDPDIVALADCRYDVAVEVPHFKPEGEVGRYRFPAMTVAQVEVRGPIDLEQRALDWLFLTWLPDSGYVPDEQPCFEAWIGRPFAHGTEHFELYAQLPVVRS
ncbi:MAG: helix-turn-helix domain-containing protein [Planctomycetes bacterium]|nr:helix-turn-helix domain-containing protein [Planctomycetota bacterium]